MGVNTDEERFRNVYAAHVGEVLSFVRRRVPDADAEDVVAEAFLVAWRRIDTLPKAEWAARAWLFGIARGCLLNQRRGNSRRDALAVRLAASGGRGEARSVEDLLLTDQADLAEAWARLSAGEQEVLALRALDDLSSTEAGRVLGITGAAYRVRLPRARRALAAQLGRADPPADTPSAAPTPTSALTRLEIPR